MHRTQNCSPELSGGTYCNTSTPFPALLLSVFSVHCKLYGWPDFSLIHQQSSSIHNFMSSLRQYLPELILSKYKIQSRTVSHPQINTKLTLKVNTIPPSTCSLILINWSGVCLPYNDVTHCFTTIVQCIVGEIN